ncbi:hypothetical protein DY78_GL002097 [Lactiplantibacillus fabifermentans DSM 21115]|uniref:Uncharacterized protein n=1 Tax=Lactiplantibacillus fabifermentans DSM 21115 TaxID=1413187 RepID=A0A0R2N8Z7_9LACO|nr:hypothetical protein DY78_GL002097 [Lactiplantibacillus fabifermentans DSM 21115]
MVVFSLFDCGSAGCANGLPPWPSRLDDEKFSNADFQQVKLAKSVLAIECLAYATTKFDDFI